MKIFLWTDKGWQLFNSKKKGFEKELQERQIIISPLAEIGNHVKIGDYAVIGDYTKIGNDTIIGHYTKIGTYTEIGDYAVIDTATKIGISAKIGDYAEIGVDVKIGDFAEIGNYVKIDDHAIIGDCAKIVKVDTFSELNVLLKTGVVMNNEEGIFYKAVRPDLTDFYSGKYQYKIGKGDRNPKLKRNQNIECGEGWHWTSFWRAIEFLGVRKGIIISAKIKLKDILAVHQEVRVKAFSNVQVVKMKGLGNLTTIKKNGNITKKRGRNGNIQ